MIDWVGIIAGLYVVLAFYSTDQMRLRRHAITSNVLFIAYALYLGLWPIVLLHSVLLPLNLKRLNELEGFWRQNHLNLHMSESERQVFEQGLKSNPHSWAIYGYQRLPNRPSFRALGHAEA